MASPQLSGYQCEFIESVEDYECPLCLHVTREPSLTSCCGQHFCQACIQKIAFYNKPCPLCKESSFTTLLDKKQRRRVLDLKVFCDKKADGCDWVGGLGELEQHLSEKCQFVSVDCPYNCGEACVRRFLAVHKIYACPKRPHSCKYCQLEGTYKYIHDHLSVCPKYPVECPNECGVAPIERGQLEGHLRECPLAMVECELKELGCEEVVQRKDADKHMEQAAQTHLRLMASHYLKSQRRQDEMIAKLQEENEKLRIELKEPFEEKQRASKFSTAQDKEMSRFRQKIYGKATQEIEPKSKELSALSSQIDILTRHVGVTSTNVTVNYMKKKIKHQRWTNTQQFRISYCSNRIHHED